MFTRFDRIHERDRHPDRRTDGQTDIARWYSVASRSRNRLLQADVNLARIHRQAGGVVHCVTPCLWVCPYVQKALRTMTGRVCLLLLCTAV